MATQRWSQGRPKGRSGPKGKSAGRPPLAALQETRAGLCLAGGAARVSARGSGPAARGSGLFSGFFSGLARLASGLFGCVNEPASVGAENGEREMGLSRSKAISYQGESRKEGTEMLVGRRAVSELREGKKPLL